MRALSDLHTHSSFSFDAEYAPIRMVEGAVKRGLREFCLTDHLDFDRPMTEWNIPDFAAREGQLFVLDGAFPGIRIGRGAEVSMAGRDCARRAEELLSGLELDFVIGSVHTIRGANVWEDAFYEGWSRRDIYRIYLEQIIRSLECFPTLDVLGHYDFVAHYAPYADRSFFYEDAPDLFDEIFRWLLVHGKTLEINSSSWEGDSPWGLDILCRFREMGGHFVTLGSDAHNPERVGARLEEAAALAEAAGLAVVTYHGHRPQPLQP